MSKVSLLGVFLGWLLFSPLFTRPSCAETLTPQEFAANVDRYSKLMLQIQQRDQVAFNTLFAELRYFLLSHIDKTIGRSNLDFREDLLNIVGYKIWDRAWQFNPQQGNGKVTSWLRSIAVSSSLDKIRNLTTRDDTLLRFQKENEDSAQAVRHEPPGIESGDLKDAIQKALGHLSKEESRAIELKMLDHSTKEIADILGKNYECTRALIKKALARLGQMSEILAFRAGYVACENLSQN